MADPQRADASSARGGDSLRPEREENEGSRAYEKTRCVVRFFANHSPPDQLKSVVEDCELLTDDDTLMNFEFVEEVCETAHDDALAVFAFVKDEEGSIVQGIMCREGKLGENVYLYPPAKLAVTVSHSDCSLILPPRPAPPICFPEEVEPYRLALETAFTRYVDMRYADATLANLRPTVRIRRGTAVYSRLLTPEAQRQKGQEKKRTGLLATLPLLKAEADLAQPSFVPSDSETALAFINEAGSWTIYKLTAVMSLRHSNPESCWAAARTLYWEAYFSPSNLRLAIEGEVRVRSHTCEDWNAQIDYRRVFRKASSGDSARETEENSTSSDQQNAGKTAEGAAARRRRETDRRDGLYLEKCEDVKTPAALCRRVLQFIRDKDAGVLREERFFRQVYVPETLRSLRRVLPLTGRSFDWQQQSLQLQPRQQI
ncbi:hypothetical protein BESB_022850 [Besnoitia besnoiti]|uniref:Capping alpha-like subunit n=1 Tax=Besnoitia besnoiti TaxID=94643 RepID=A0A2A9M7Z6_BESBE|nr:hypothetical protein BESB_022850 [Besnoitia besnoiti]PFH31793.1 hypothetical protein BESB_022850 [Besnoitia besnoiti]